MRIKRIDPISAAKVGGVLYAGLGLVIGAFVSLVIMAIGGAAALSDEGSRAAPFVGVLFGAGSIVILPIFYGVLGAVVMLITALLYNLAAKIAGGIQIEVEQ
jgi:transmembrane protein DUF3566